MHRLTSSSKHESILPGYLRMHCFRRICGCEKESCDYASRTWKFENAQCDCRRTECCTSGDVENQCSRGPCLLKFMQLYGFARFSLIYHLWSQGRSRWLTVTDCDICRKQQRCQQSYEVGFEVCVLSLIVLNVL